MRRNRVPDDAGFVSVRANRRYQNLNAANSNRDSLSRVEAISHHREFALEIVEWRPI